MKTFAIIYTTLLLFSAAASLTEQVITRRSDEQAKFQISKESPLVQTNQNNNNASLNFSNCIIFDLCHKDTSFKDHIVFRWTLQPQNKTYAPNRRLDEDLAVLHEEEADLVVSVTFRDICKFCLVWKFVIE